MPRIRKDPSELTKPVTVRLTDTERKYFELNYSNCSEAIRLVGPVGKYQQALNEVAGLREQLRSMVDRYEPEIIK